MRISTSKSEAMVLRRKRVEFPLQVGDEFLPQVEEFKYLGVLFMSDGRRELEIDRQIGAAAAVNTVPSIYDTALTYGHELWVLTEKTRLRMQAAEMGFLQRVAGLSLKDKVRSSVIQEGLRVKLLLPPHRKE
ncbi:triosephosphate isomerase (TIM) [Sarotherodon galilaeus]